MQIVTLYGTRNAVASGKSLYHVKMSVGSFSSARDLLRVARENPLVSYPFLIHATNLKLHTISPSNHITPPD